MEEELERDDEFLGVDGGAEGPLLPPRIEEPEPVVQNPNLPGVPLRFGEGMGLEWERDQEEASATDAPILLQNGTFKVLDGSEESSDPDPEE